ncbi:MAG: hypothetical protein AAF899_17320 [Pseudomonadota bacterium]
MRRPSAFRTPRVDDVFTADPKVVARHPTAASNVSSTGQIDIAAGDRLFFGGLDTVALAVETARNADPASLGPVRLVLTDLPRAAVSTVLPAVATVLPAKR